MLPNPIDPTLRESKAPSRARMSLKSGKNKSLFLLFCIFVLMFYKMIHGKHSLITSCACNFKELGKCEILKSQEESSEL